MDVKSLNGTSGRWSDISLAVPFDTDMDRQIRDKLMDAVEEALKGNANCGYDPFGAERFGIKRHNCGYIQKNGSYIVGIGLRIVMDTNYDSDVSRELIRQDMLPAVQRVAAQFGVRATVVERSSKLFDAELEDKTIRRNVLINLFECRFYRTVFHDEAQVPTEKIEWDAYCAHCATLPRDVPPKRLLNPNDFGITFKKGRYEYELVGVYKHRPWKYVVGKRIGEGSTGKEILIPREEMEQICYELQCTDKDALALENAKDEEAAFYRNKEYIRYKLERYGIDISYREMYSFDGHDFIIIGIQPKAHTYPFVVRCVDEDGPMAGKVSKQRLENVLAVIAAERRNQ